MNTERYSDKDYEIMKAICEHLSTKIKGGLAVLVTSCALSVVFFWFSLSSDLPLIGIISGTVAIITFIYVLIKVSEWMHYNKGYKEGVKQVIIGELKEKQEYHTKHNAYYIIEVGQETFDIDISKYTHLAEGDRVKIEQCCYSEVLFSVTKTGPEGTNEQGREPAGDEIAKRLEQLDSLRDQELITEEEYREKRQSIIDEI